MIDVNEICYLVSDFNLSLFLPDIPQAVGSYAERHGFNITSGFLIWTSESPWRVTSGNSFNPRASGSFSIK